LVRRPARFIDNAIATACRCGTPSSRTRWLIFFDSGVRCFLELRFFMAMGMVPPLYELDHNRQPSNLVA
jgi:hypothetical protein